MLRPAFKATPIPRACSVQIYHKKMAVEERERRERIRKAAESACDAARMPQTMQMAADRKKNELKKPEADPYSFRPTLGPEFDRSKMEKAHARMSQ